ncbi:MAG: hypothetical protein OZ948_16250, partial [Deltaproteobacteria bacterium]|nr:hypothetical protein [Deltaproteobacteria bacterium]
MRARAGTARCALSALWLAVGSMGLAGAPAGAFEYFDGRLQVHGYFGQQVRAIGRNLDPGDGVELAQ